MADYTSTFEDASRLTYTVGATAVTGGQLVEISAAKTVIPSSGTAGKAVVGVAAYDAPVGARVTVLKGGVQRATAGTGGVTAGQPVKAAASGALVVWVVGTDAPADLLGRAITTATATNPVDFIWGI